MRLIHFMCPRGTGDLERHKARSKLIFTRDDIAIDFLLRWCCPRDLIGSPIPVITGGFELRISCMGSSYLTHKAVRPLWPSGLSNYFVYKRFVVQTLLWSLELMIQINLEHKTIAVWNLARSWSISIDFSFLLFMLFFSWVIFLIFIDMPQALLSEQVHSIYGVLLLFSFCFHLLKMCYTP